jgi:hypothetical protein
LIDLVEWGKGEPQKAWYTPVWQRRCPTQS